MPANPWELRTDVRPLDAAAQAWREVAEVMARRGDELVEVARRTTEGWQAAAADGYEQHRRQVLARLDLFTTLEAIGAVVTAAQKELDQSWATVAMVPHEAVGESRHLVFHPSEDDHRGAVARAQREAEEVRGRLRTALDLEGERLRAARSELVVVRQELTTLSGGTFPQGWSPGDGVAGGLVGGSPSSSSSSTSVRGSAQAGVGALPPMAPISAVPVVVPDIAGLSSTGLAAGAAAALGRRGAAKRSTQPTPPPVGGMGAGAMGARAGSMSRGGAGARAGVRRMPAPMPEGAGAARGPRGAGGAGGGVEDDDARVRKQAEREAKRALLEEKRAERAARRARREAGDERDERDGRDEATTDEAATERDRGEAAERPAAITVVHYEPGDAPAADREADDGGGEH